MIHTSLIRRRERSDAASRLQSLSPTITTDTVNHPYEDPSSPTHPPESLQKRRWKKFLRRLVKPSKSSARPPQTNILLTERNLTEFFDPAYNDEHDAFHSVRSSRKLSIPEWLQLLP